MSEQTFRDAWLEQASRQGPLRRAFMRSVAGNRRLMTQLEVRCQEERAENPGKYGSGWSAIIAALLPVLLKMLQEWFEQR